MCSQAIVMHTLVPPDAIVALLCTNDELELLNATQLHASMSLDSGQICSLERTDERQGAHVWKKELAWPWDVEIEQMDVSIFCPLHTPILFLLLRTSRIEIEYLELTVHRALKRYIFPASSSCPVRLISP